MKKNNLGIKNRKIIIDTLIEDSQAFKKEILERNFSKYNIKTEDKKFIVECVNGIIKYNRLLSYLVKKYSHKVHKSPIVNNIIYLGLYQLLILDQIPDYASISTSVELLKKYKFKKDTKYVNALLRNIQRDIKIINTFKEGEEYLPINKNKTIKFNKKIFPNPKKDNFMYRSIVYSYPLFLVKKWSKKFGKDKTLELLINGNIPPSLILRIRDENFTKDIETELKEKDIEFELKEKNLIILKKNISLENLECFKNGKCIVSGYTSKKIVESLLNNLSHDRDNIKVIDICAAPGGKTIYISDLLKSKGKILAIDISYERLLLLKKLIDKFNIKNIELLVIDAKELPEKFYNKFDYALVDVPCSNSGVFAKRPEARWRFTKEELEHLQKLQLEILEKSAKTLKKGGEIVYSTCSIEDEENKEIIDKFINNKNFKIIENFQILPLKSFLDGGTFFKLKKIEEV